MKFKNPGMKSEKNQENQESNISKKNPWNHYIKPKKCMNPKWLKKMKLWGKKSEIA